jgi:hypothetical protein
MQSFWQLGVQSNWQQGVHNFAKGIFLDSSIKKLFCDFLVYSFSLSDL